MTIQSDSTGNGESLETKPSSDLSVDGAAELYLKRMSAAAKPADGAKNEQKTEQENTGDNEENHVEAEESDDDKSDAKDKSTTDEDADSAEGDDKAETGKDKPPVYADDSHKVKFQVDGKDHEISVKDLKRLAGQEKALTQRSQEVAESQKKWKSDVERNVTAYKKLADRAYEQFKPYQQIDWPLMATRLSAEDYKALKADSADAEQNLRFVVEELDATMKDAQGKAQEQLKEAGAKCSAALSDPKSPHYIKDWGKETYDAIRTFAIDAGLNPEAANTMTDPAAYKLIHEAMLYRKGKAEAKQAITRAKNKVVSEKTLRPTSQDGGGQAPRDQAAMRRLKETGSMDDAVAAYAARLSARERSSD